MKMLLSVGATVVALSLLAGCGGDDDSTAKDPATTPPTSDATEPADEPTVGTYPEFEAESYTYVLEQICFCPITGPVEVTVEDGEVTSATLLEGAPGMKKGSEAPDYLRITINDVIDRANDTGAAAVHVVWPDGQDWPSRVEVDKAEMATDDEVHYIVRRVEVP